MFTATPLTLASAAAAFTIAVSAGRLGSDIQKSQYAAQWTGLSPSCQETLASLVDSKSDISQCSRLGTLFNEVVSLSAVNPDESLVQPLQVWLEDEFCAKVPCDSTTINDAYTAITESCEADLKKQFWIPLAVQNALMSYVPGLEALCLKDSGAADNSTSYCPAEVLNNIETSGTPITYQQGQLALDKPLAAVDAVPTWAYCQPCAQGLLAPVVNALNVLNPAWAAQVQGAVDGRCGAGFANGVVPDSLENGITYEAPGTGNETGGGANGGTDDTGEGFDPISTGFRIQALAYSSVLLLSVALFVVTGL